MTGGGMIRGLLITFKQYLGTYRSGRWLLKTCGLDQGEGLFTIPYPETKQKHAEAFRYFPFLVYDESPEDMRCVACKICEQECPPKCIHITMEKDEKGAPVKRFGRTYPAQFDIDVSICMSCRICVDVCPFDAIEMDNDYELADYSRGEELLFTRDKLLKSAEYFSSIKPTEHAEVEKRLAPKRAKAKAAAEAQARKAAEQEAQKPDQSQSQRGNANPSTDS